MVWLETASIFIIIVYLKMIPCVNKIIIITLLDYILIQQNPLTRFQRKSSQVHKNKWARTFRHMKRDSQNYVVHPVLGVTSTKRCHKPVTFISSFKTKGVTSATEKLPPFFIEPHRNSIFQDPHRTINLCISIICRGEKYI